MRIRPALLRDSASTPHPLIDNLKNKPTQKEYNMLNLIISGNLGNDPELRQTNSGKWVTDLNIAHNIDENNTEWYTVTVFGKQAENCAEYLGKGKKVIVSSGIVTSEAWTDDAGNAKSRVKIIARQVEFC